MISRFMTDEDFNQVIIDQVRRKRPELDIVGVRGVGLEGAADPVILEWAAQHQRVVLSHDVNTMTKHAIERLEQGLPLLGLVVVPPELDIGRAVEDTIYIAEVGTDTDFDGQIVFLPF